jgi:hypothetical protein
VTHDISVATLGIMQSNRKPLANALKREWLDFHGLTIILYSKHAPSKGDERTTVVKERRKPR